MVATIELAERIPTTVIAYSTASLLGGSATLSLEATPPSDDAPDGYLATDGRGQITGTIRSRLIEQVRNELDNYVLPFVELAENLNDLVKPLSEDDPNAAKENVRTIVRGVNETIELFKGFSSSLPRLYCAPASPYSAKGPQISSALA